ncbi:daunorubicin C-13 ketoreductase [Bisporella sp. PMI_857]|nr:daunorubicin C-13 ketoreductase [Bisporella sp. PMI_857]
MSKPWDPLGDMPDLHGKVAVVTGANSGIGFAIVKLLALHGAKVYYTTRSEAKAQKTREALQASSPDINLGKLEWLRLDISDLKSITAAADELKKKETKVDILINNAGAATSSTELVGRWEYHMAVNHIGPFVFANRILPLLKNALTHADADVRIVNLNSTAQVGMLPSSFKFNFDSPAGLVEPVSSYPWQWRYLGRFVFGFDMIRYAVSKAANFLFAQELQRRLDAQHLPILSIAVHPGEVATEGVMNTNTALVRFMARLLFLKPEQGAVSPLFAATATEVRRNSERYKGRFLLPVGKVTPPNPVAADERQVKGLWDNTTEEVNKQLVADGLPTLQPW